MAETTKWKTRQEADEALSEAETTMLDAESILKDAEDGVQSAEAEFERSRNDCDKAKKMYKWISDERRKVFLGHTPDPASCLEPLEITKGG